MNDLTITERLNQMIQPHAPTEPETLDLVEYWRSVSKRKWGILALTLLVGVLTTLVVFSIRPSYRATTTLLIEQGKNKIVSIEEVYNNLAGGNREYFQTQVEIIKSRELAQRVVQKLNLAKHPDFDPTLEQNASWLTRQTQRWLGDPKPQSEEAIFKGGVGQFSRNLQVQPIRNSQLVQISFTAHDRELSAIVPNTLAEVYIESDLEAKVAMTQKASAWMSGRMGELRTKLEASERALQDYRERERIVDVKGVALSGAAKGLEEAMSGLTSARTKRAEAENLYNQVQSIRLGKSAANYDSIPAVLRNPTVQRFKELEGEAERKLSDASKRYGAEHPKMIQANAELASARENTRRQIETVVAGLSKEYEVARANEQAIERALGQSKAEIQSINRKEFQLGVLEREAQANRQLYDMFLTRSKETNVSSDLQSTVARVIDAAVVPGGPYAPNKTQIIGIAMTLALILGIMLALLLERLNNTLNTTHDVEHKLGLPMLGYLQRLPRRGNKNFHSELAFFNDSQSLFSESIRTVRTAVLMSALDSPKKVLLVTSSLPAEGKTTVAFNLACALSQVKKVLLVDADLRRPKIGKLTGRSANAPGLSSLVAGTAQVSQCVFLDEKSGAYVLPAGIVPPNPLELLTSQRFAEVVDKLKEAFDVVVIDSPPLQLVSDAMVLSTFATSLIYVVKAGSTPYQLARAGIKRLRLADAPMIGVVLNQLDLDKAERYYGEYGGYGSRGYGKKRHAYGYGPPEK